MNLIAAVSSDWGIGFENNLLFHIREDLIYFKKMTTKKICVMGYNTLISLPDSKPLKNRTTVVLSRKKNLKIDGAIVCDSLESLDAVLSEFDERDVFVCGGEKIYSQLINRCKTAYITKVDANPPADAFLQNFDELARWKKIDESEKKICGGFFFKFVIYESDAVKNIP